MKHIIGVLLLYAVSFCAYSQSDSTEMVRFVKIDNIQIVGNVRTKDHIIFREMKLKEGDYLNYNELHEQLELDRQNIYNLRLFNSVEMKVINLSSDTVIIIVQVNERWYLFPSLILELVDRNFNDWWENNNHDFSRLNYGVRLYQQNVRGRNETLKVTGQLGYTKQFGLSYEMPYIDKAQKTGLELLFTYSENSNVAYETVDHLRHFLDKDYALRSRLKAGFVLSRRNSFYDYHNLGLNYHHNRVDNAILELNPNYFVEGDSSQQYLSLTYVYKRNKRDVIAYPLKGYYIEGLVRKNGLGLFNDINTAMVNFNYSNYFDLGKGMFIANHTSSYFSTTDKIAYNLYYGLGYGKFLVRGYELYVIEGDQFLLNKTSLKKRIVNTTTTISKMPVEQFRHFPFQVYLKAYFDAGYVRNFQNYDQNSLYSNRLIYGGGIGLDFVTAYDVVFRTEYSWNDVGQGGFYLHVKKEF